MDSRETTVRGIVWSHSRQAPYCPDDAGQTTHEHGIPRNSLGNVEPAIRFRMMGSLGSPATHLCDQHFSLMCRPFMPLGRPVHGPGRRGQTVSRLKLLGKPVRRPRDCTDRASISFFLLLFSTCFFSLFSRRSCTRVHIECKYVLSLASRIHMMSPFVPSLSETFQIRKLNNGVLMLNFCTVPMNIASHLKGQYCSICILSEVQYIAYRPEIPPNPVIFPNSRAEPLTANLQ